ncbi:MAG TPA: hypothetical protein VIF09_26510, partial [Polyangiaceae bacterium]
MRNAILLAMGAVCAVAAAFACSSSSSGGGGGNCGYSQGGTTNQACTSCVESSCSSQISTYNGACSDYSSCVCSAGSNASALQACQSKASEGSCPSAAQGVSSCVASKCSSQCNNSSSSSGGTSSSSGSASSSGSSSGSASSSGGTSSSGGGTPTGT